ncbi:MAG: hypothetical protein LH618_16810 [Saprospiraceae bacterium]|nr:hypothetical protein [Saprospiraceae bacterium]
MSVAEVKNELIMQILQTEDQLLLKHLAQYFQNLLTNKNWWADLPDLQKELLEEELEDVRLYDESKNRREERIPLEDYLAQRKADAHA